MKKIYESSASFLRFLQNNAENTSDILYLHDVSYQQGGIASLSELDVKIISSSLISSVLIGSYFTSSIYQYMIEKYRNKSITPIDTLILASTVTQHLISIFLTGILTVGISFDITFSHYFGEFTCELIWYSTIYCGAYRAYGSLGIAIYRVLLMKASHWIHRFDQKKAIGFVLLLSITISFGIAVGFGTGHGPASRKRIVWNWCKGHSQTLREVTDDYALITGAISDESELVAKLSLLGSLLGGVAELCCYVVFFSHLHSHDKGLVGRKVIKDTEFRRRRQKNCISFMAQFYGFLVECVTYGLMGIGMIEGSNILFRVIVTFGFWMEFGINSFIVVISSEKLIDNLPHNRYFK